MFRAVAAFADFTPDNDPQGGHDFGSVEVGGKTVFFKIDAYDLDLRGHSPDPEDTMSLDPGGHEVSPADANTLRLAYLRPAPEVPEGPVAFHRDGCEPTETHDRS